MWTDKNTLKMQSSNLTGVQFPCKIRILSDSVTIYTGAGFEYVTAGSVSNRDFPEIMEIREGKESILWGRLKSSAGWIPLDKAKIVINECME